jgi:hypothetical protein
MSISTVIHPFADHYQRPKHWNDKIIVLKAFYKDARATEGGHLSESYYESIVGK